MSKEMKAEEFLKKWFEDNPPTINNGGLYRSPIYGLTILDSWYAKCMEAYAQQKQPTLTDDDMPMWKEYSDCIDWENTSMVEIDDAVDRFKQDLVEALQSKQLEEVDLRKELGSFLNFIENEKTKYRRTDLNYDVIEDYLTKTNKL